MWTDYEALPPSRLHRGGWHGLLPDSSQLIPALSHATAQRKLLPPAPDFRFDRRDADDRGAGGDRPIHQDHAGRARLSTGAHRAATRPCTRRNRRGTGDRPLYPARGRAGGPPGEALQGTEPAVPVNPWAGPAAAAILPRRR